MFIESFVLSGLIGLGCWAVAIIDGIIRINIPKTRRQRQFDNIASAFVAVGSIGVAYFAYGLYSLLP